MNLKTCVAGAGLTTLLIIAPVYAADCVTSFDQSCLQNSIPSAPGEDERQNESAASQLPQRTGERLQLQVILDAEVAERDLLERERIQQKRQAYANSLNGDFDPRPEDVPRGLDSRDFAAWFAAERARRLAQAYVDIDAAINQRLAESWERTLAAEQDFVSEYATEK